MILRFFHFFFPGRLDFPILLPYIFPDIFLLLRLIPASSSIPLPCTIITTNSNLFRNDTIS